MPILSTSLINASLPYVVKKCEQYFCFPSKYVSLNVPIGERPLCYILLKFWAIWVISPGSIILLAQNSSQDKSRLTTTWLGLYMKKNGASVSIQRAWERERNPSLFSRLVNTGAKWTRGSVVWLPNVKGQNEWLTDACPIAKLFPLRWNNLHCAILQIKQRAFPHILTAIPFKWCICALYTENIHILHLYYLM
jgi:hypothetical protein